jgi:hypothetical protein
MPPSRATSQLITASARSAGLADGDSSGRPAASTGCCFHARDSSGDADSTTLRVLQPPVVVAPT